MYKIYIYYRRYLMRNFKPVQLPERTVVTNTKSGKYVYLTQKVEYHSELKCSRPKRVGIGKLNDEGLLIPNKNYYELFGEEVELEEPGERADFVSVGMQLIVEKIAELLQLDKVLYPIFKDDADKIMDIATYMIINENNVMQYFEDYGYNHSLNNVENFTDTTVGRLLEHLKVKDIDLFIRTWVKMYADHDIYISYDSTNMNCVAGNLELAEYGHAKDNPELPQVNMSLAYNQTNQIPLFYEVYPGSIIDNTECEKMVDRASYYGCKNIGFILDRGYFSLKNIRYFEKAGYEYVLMTKGNARFVQEAVEECGAILKNGYTGYIEEHGLYGMTLEKEMFTKDRKQYVHVYYNGIEAEKEKLNINEKYRRMDEVLEEKVERKLQRKEDLKQYENYYKVKYDDNGYFVSYQRKESRMRELVNKAGYFVIVTSKEMSAKEALDIYRDRDAVEKVFRMEKSYLGFDVFRVHTEGKLESKIFVSFIALIIRNELYQRLKPLYKKNRKEYTVPKAIRQYERMGLTKLSDNKYHQRYSLTNKQKKLLEILELKESDYKKFIEKIKDQLN